MSVDKLAVNKLRGKRVTVTLKNGDTHTGELVLSPMGGAVALVGHPMPWTFLSEIEAVCEPPGEKH